MSVVAVEKPDLRNVYVEAVRSLAKATESKPKRGFVKAANGIQDRYERVLVRFLQRWQKKAKAKIPEAKLQKVFSKLEKSENDDIRNELEKIIGDAFAGAPEELLAELQPLVDDLAKEFHSVYEVDLNFDVINTRAEDYLRSNAVNYFSTLSDAQAKGIFATIADGLASDEGYSLRTLVSDIAGNFLTDTMYFDTVNGPRAMDITDWAMSVARSETSRAASFAQQSINESLDLKTWQWLTQESGCDICEPNDSEIVEMGEDFPSGDSEPPAHVNCRCIVIAVMDELTAIQDDGNSQDDEYVDNTDTGE